MAEIVGFGIAAGEPIEMGLMPVLAVQNLVINRQTFYFLFKFVIMKQGTFYFSYFPSNLD